ncbi:MAG: hypothetical protein JWR38_1639 [Mucilaginibacter sp.]|nr:hypothetical protein [Mucilaginibacter sp.]
MIAATVMGQKKKSIVNLIQSERSTGTKINGRDAIKVYKGVFKQDFSTLRSDSAYFYPQDNAFDAFGNVNINQGDTLNIFSDKLNYNGNTKLAILTSNVKMVDRDATLTTDYLTYNTASRIGTYTGGGKLVNKDNVLTSKNGYYFAYSRDSYFRYDVVLTTIDAIIKTDTLRYNTGTRISYFYGPTNIYGKKDKDTLYTENGLYNTITEQAFFGKHNLYKQGTKSLKGDSLFYDRLKGYGRAVKNITFNDNEQRITLKGDLGTYFKADERTVVTQYAYMVMVTEQKDTTQTDSVNTKTTPIQAKNVKGLVTDTKNITNMTKMAAALKPKVTISKADSTKVDSTVKALAGKNKNVKVPTDIKSITNMTTMAANLKPPQGIVSKADSVKAGQVVKQLASQNKNMLLDKDGKKPPLPADTAKHPEKIKRDSIFMTADTLETQIMTYKNLKIYQEKQRMLHFRDTSERGLKLAVLNNKLKGMPTVSLHIPKDTTYLHRNIFGKPKVDSTQIKKDKLNALRKAKQDSLRQIQMKKDPVFATREFDVSDTARIRIVIAHHHAKIFKSDLQGKADSIFYSNSDSTIRCYVNPIFWTQGSQLSGDTVYLQMRNKKLDNMELFPSAFVVNIEKEDSVHFNQASGRKMRGFFKNDKMDRLYIAVNAESIFFKRDSGKVAGMQRSLSSRIRTNFNKGEVSDIVFLTKPENRYIPIAKVTEEDKTLKGFIWKPKERPVSKESIIPSHRKKIPVVKAPPPKTKADSLKQAKADSLKGALSKLNKDSTKTDTSKLHPVKTGKDTVSKAGAVKPGAIKAVKDTVGKAGSLPVIKAVKDTISKTGINKLPVKAVTDTVKNPAKKPGS